MNVVITSIRARFIDPSGAPLQGLKPNDLAVRVAGQDVPILAVDWFADSISPSDKADARPPASVDHSTYTRHRVSTLGQLFVFYVQAGPKPADRKDSRALRQALPAVRQLVGRLKADDLAAVVSYDDRLHLELDFTRDHQAVADAIEHAASNPQPLPVQPSASAVSLAPAFAAPAMRQAVGPELALERTALALDRLPGEKVTIYLALEARPFAEPKGGTFMSTNTFGLGVDYGRSYRVPPKGPQQTPEMTRAILALQSACASLFVLDNSSGSQDTYHANLQTLARSTGGTYGRLRRASAKSVEQLARTITGYYVLTVNPEDLHAAQKWQRVELSLKGKKKVEVLATPLWVATKPFR